LPSFLRIEALSLYKTVKLSFAKLNRPLGLQEVEASRISRQ
jgi:hypothetical protein